jgi:hypothetical protein
LIKIAHRGNVFGKEPDRENEPDYLLRAINMGFDVEVDVWVLDDTVWFGHDSPVYGPIGMEFLDTISDAAWFHCKNLEALVWFKKNNNSFRYFWHEEDSYTLTSNGYIWTYPGMQLSQYSILVDLDNKIETSINLFGVCSDSVGV